MEHYVSLLQEQQQCLHQLGVRYVTADAYFAKQSFMDAMQEMNFHVVTRLRQDANLRYLYSGPRNPTGRPKKYAGKVDCKHIDKRRLRLCWQERNCEYYSGLVYAVALKRQVRIVYIQENKGAQRRSKALKTKALKTKALKGAQNKGAQRRSKQRCSKQRPTLSDSGE
jgi:hypothetical protein